MSERAVGAKLSAVLAGLLMAAAAGAAEVYTVRFATSNFLGDVECERLRWVDQLIFHNTTGIATTIRLLGVSNGDRDPGSRDLSIPAHTTIAVAGDDEPLRWYPTPRLPKVWTIKLDVPDGVVVASRAEVAQSFGSPCFPSTSSRVWGGLPFPIVRTLIPANVPQYHMGTDLGADDIGASANARVNVGIYNSSAVTAVATIELRRGCDDDLIEQRAVSIPPNSLIQFAGLSSGQAGTRSCLNFKTPFRTTYVVVTVDQSSFSYAATLSNEVPPKFPAGISMTH